MVGKLHFRKKNNDSLTKINNQKWEQKKKPTYTVKREMNQLSS